MEHNISVSVLIPFYKVEKYIEKTLASVFIQTYQIIDYVFVNDCSPDNSLQVLHNTITKFGIGTDKYMIINHKKNEGIAKSRMDCITHAKGDYIYFVDGDDWIEKDAIEKMVAATKNGTIEIVGCDFMKDYVSGKTTYHNEQYAETCWDNMLKCLNYDIAKVLWKLLIKKSLLDNLEISPINIGEDYIISIKLFFYANTFVSLNHAFYHYVQYNENRLSLQSRRSIDDHIKCVKEVERFLRKNGVYDNYVDHQLLLRKSNIKSNFVLNKRLMDEKAFNSTFPEAKGVWHEMDYTFIECAKFWIAEHGLFKLLKLL